MKTGGIMQVRPLQDRVIVRRLDEETKTAGGIKGLNSHTQKITDSGVKLATKPTPNDCKKLSIRTYREHEKSSSARNGGLLIGVEHPDEDKGENI